MAEGSGDLVSDTGGAIVAEEIIHVIAVLGFGVFAEEDEEVVEFLVGEAQALFPDGASFETVFSNELVEGGDAKAVVEFAAGEGPVEMRDVEIEGAVVEDIVGGVGGVEDADGTVAEGGVELVAGAAGDDAGEGRVGEKVGGGFLRTGAEGEQEQEGKEKVFFHGMAFSN